MSRFLVNIALGVLFAVGLGISGMTSPDKVIAFLDPLNGWDASLGFVMVGAIAVHAIGQRWVRQRGMSLFGGAPRLPDKSDFDLRLVGGSALFGMGWGLGGFCPGPGVVASTTLGAEALVFTGGMLLGLWAVSLFDAQGAPASESRVPPAEDSLPAV